MPRQSSQLLLAILTAGLLSPAMATDFCVRDADGALWVDCEAVVVGAVHTRTKCRREDQAELIFVEPHKRLDPGADDCPAAANRSVALDKDGIPRNGDEPPAEDSTHD